APARPPERLLRMVTAVSGPGVTMTRMETPRKAINELSIAALGSRIDQHAGIHHPLGIELALGAAQRLGEQLGPLLVVERPMEAADRVMMGGRAAMLHGGGGAGRQHPHELVRRDAPVQSAAEGEVEAGPDGIDVGETAGHRAVASSDTPDRVLRDLRDLLMEVAHALPGHRRLEGRGEDAARHRMLAVVRRADELVAPGAGGAAAMGVLVVGTG